MSKYQVGDQLIVIESINEEMEKLVKNTEMKVTEDNYATLSLGVRIVNVEYANPNVTLTYRNHEGKESKVFATCLDPNNFDENRALEKALLQAFQNEIIRLTAIKNCNICK
jgi:hypothetical protein